MTFLAIITTLGALYIAYLVVVFLRDLLARTTDDAPDDAAINRQIRRDGCRLPVKH